MATGPGAAAGVPKPRALHGAGRGGCHPGDTLNLRLPPLKARRRARAALFVRCRAAPRAGPCHATGPPGVAAAEVAVAGGDRRDTEGRVGAGEAQGAAPGHRRLRRSARAGARGRAGWLPRPRRHTKMSAGEKINPCVAAAALPPPLLPPSPDSACCGGGGDGGGGSGAGGASFLKRPHQTLGSAPLQAGRAKGPGARLPGRPGRPGGGFATAAPGLRPDIPL